MIKYCLIKTVWRSAGILTVFALVMCNLVFGPYAEAADELKIVYRGGVSFANDSTRLVLKADEHLLNIEGGTKPYSVSMTNQILDVKPNIWRGQQTGQFYVVPKATGTTLLTVKDSKGNSIKREIIVYDPGVQPLVLGTLPDVSNPVAVGQGRGFGVTGGKTPYKIISANPGIARVEPSGVIFSVWGVAAGTTQIVVTDANGAKVQGNVYVGTTKPLYLSVDSTLLPGGKGELVISSGNPSYTVTTSANLSAVLKGNDSYGRIVYIISAQSAGVGTVTVKDSKGQTESKTITVKEWVSLEFPELTGSLRTIDIGQTTKLHVKGGTPAYDVTAIPAAAVSIVKQAGSEQYAVTGRQAGVARIIVKDGTGATRELSLTVRNLPTLTIIAPEALIVGGDSGMLSFIGGAEPFTVTTSDNKIVLTKIEEKKYQISPRVPGTATITVKDSKGTTVQKKVTVTAPLLRLELAATTLEIGQSGVLDIKGGTGPFAVTLSNSNAKAVFYATNPTYTRYNLTGVVAGTVDVTVKDSAGATATTRLTIQSQKLQIIMSSSTLKLGETGAAAIRTISIQGGIAPYTATVTGSQLSLNKLSASQYQMIPRAPGMATITVRDNIGATASQSITVLPLGANPLTMQMSVTTLRRGQNLEIRMLGGTGPYRLQQDGGPPLQFLQTGPNVFSAKSIYTGTARIRGIDARGQQVTSSVTIIY